MDVSAYMEKYGWKPGMGLGKDNNGISEHIRVSKKANKKGIGMDSAKSFEPWWEKLYNKTAQQSINESKKKETKGEEEPKKAEPEQQQQQQQQQKSAGQLRVLGARLAPMFVKGSTLDLSKTQDTNITKSTDSSDSDSDSDSSDDELVRPISTSKDTFEALGRRTGKKYSAGGKLSRLEAQEKKWSLSRSNSVSPALQQVSNSSSPAPVPEDKNSEKNMKRKREKEDENNVDENDGAVGEPEKKKKKKHHHHHHHHHHKKEGEEEEGEKINKDSDDKVKDEEEKEEEGGGEGKEDEVKKKEKKEKRKKEKKDKKKKKKEEEN